MKKILIILLLGILSAGSVNAQSEKAGQSSKALYGEFGGSGLIFSGNFDSRFKGHKGLGFRVGIGFFAASDVSVVTFPLGLNALIGNGPHYFEIGASGTLTTASVTFFDETDKGSAWFFMPHFGYRFTKPTKSFNGRIYVGPVLAGGQAFFPWGGLSVGFTL
jgi:hypothetical protein